MNLEWKRFKLKLRYPFQTARARVFEMENIFLRLEWAGNYGYGESSPVGYLGQSSDKAEEVLMRFKEILENRDPRYWENLFPKLSAEYQGQSSVLSAIDMARHDLAGKVQGNSAGMQLGVAPGSSPAPATSITVGIDDAEMISRKLDNFEGFPIVKVKLGSPDGIRHDTEIVEMVRSKTDAIIRVDANCGWDLDSARKMLPVLEKCGVEFLEQPMHWDAVSDQELFFKESTIPIIADESVQGADDLGGLGNRYHGINIKLMKCGGMTNGQILAKKAREMGLKVMFGCMLESSVAISAAFALAPLADYLDLDGHLLITNDPFSGVACDKGVLEVKGDGLGINDSSGLWKG